MSEYAINAAFTVLLVLVYSFAMFLSGCVYMDIRHSRKERVKGEEKIENNSR